MLCFVCLSTYLQLLYDHGASIKLPLLCIFTDISFKKKLWTDIFSLHFYWLSLDLWTIGNSAHQVTSIPCNVPGFGAWQAGFGWRGGQMVGGGNWTPVSSSPVGLGAPGSYARSLVQASGLKQLSVAVARWEGAWIPASGFLGIWYSGGCAKSLPLLNSILSPKYLYSFNFICCNWQGFGTSRYDLGKEVGWWSGQNPVIGLPQCWKF